MTVQTLYKHCGSKNKVQLKAEEAFWGLHYKSKQKVIGNKKNKFADNTSQLAKISNSDDNCCSTCAKTK